MTDRTRPSPDGDVIERAAYVREHLADYLRDWRMTACKHTISMDREPCCSPCLRDRIIASGLLESPEPRRSEAEIEAEPVWAAISTDPERPTLARVTFAGYPDGIVSRWWRDRDRLYNDESHYDTSSFYADYVTSVTVLHTYDPETHVPVERAPSADSVLVRELRLSLGLTCPDEYMATALRSALAALADWAGRSATEAKAAALREASEALWGAVDAMRRARRGDQ